MRLHKIYRRENNKSGKSTPFFQTKLTVNQPNDIYEQEADAVSDKIMRMPSNANAFFKPANTLIQQKCAHCEEEEKEVQAKCAHCEEEEKEGQTKGKSGGTTLTLVDSVINSGGQPLDASTKSFMEPRFGHDFGNVQIHNDSAAQQSSSEINALAYTHKNHIVFGAGQYRPETSAGKQLLAHELTHVIQQKENETFASSIQRQPDRDPSKLNDEDLNSEWAAIKEYVNTIAIDDPSYEDEWIYYNDVRNEVKKRCIKDTPSHPADISQKLIDRITGKYASIDKDPGEGLFLTPYVASEGQCTIGYGHVIFPKSLCQVTSEEVEGKTKKSCVCQPPFNAISKDKAIELLRSDIRSKAKEVHTKVKVDLNQAEFDAMMDLVLHVGSMPKSFLDFVHENWCTDKEAVRERYLKTAITMKDPDTKVMKVMKNFVERRKRRAW